VDLTKWAWLILPLGVCRATQMVLVDRIFARPRAALLRWLNPNGYDLRDSRRGYLSYLLECPWCVSVWLGGAAVALVAWEETRPWALFVLAALALSLAAVFMDRLVDKWTPDEPPASTGDLIVNNTFGAPPDIPPAHVAEAFQSLTGDEHTGST
jgi:hypothetical protein